MGDISDEKQIHGEMPGSLPPSPTRSPLPYWRTWNMPISNYQQQKYHKPQKGFRGRRPPRWELALTVEAAEDKEAAPEIHLERKRPHNKKDAHNPAVFLEGVSLLPDPDPNPIPDD